MLDRRAFTAALPTLFSALAAAQSTVAGKAPENLKTLASGTWKPGPEKSSQAGRASRQYTLGALKAGNIRLEMHETIQQAGAEHEPVGTHLHNEIWCIQRGVATLFINGTEHRLEAGDVGLVCAGDQHWIKNEGDTELAYFVLAVGPPE